MSVSAVSSIKEDRNYELEYLKQAIEHFARISDIIEQVEQEFLRNTRWVLSVLVCF